MTGIKDIEYGYWYNCVHCGTENAYGLTEAEAEEYIKDWEEDNRDLVEAGEDDGERVADWNYNVIAREAEWHKEEKQACWKCNKIEEQWLTIWQTMLL